MSEGMPSSWRYLSSASSRFSSLTGYLQREVKRAAPLNGQTIEKQGWRTWAGQKIKLRRGQNDKSNSGMETVTLFPGWATRRYRKIDGGEHEDAFEVDVFVSGFASRHREVASRSQRAFIRLAKGFASLPKLTADVISPEAEPFGHLAPSTEELLAQIKLPPRPTEIKEDYEIELLERHFKSATVPASDQDSLQSSSSSSSELSAKAPLDLDATPRPPPAPEYRNPATAIPAEVLRKLHANLESRLRPFWSSVLPARSIRLHLFASPHFPILSRISGGSMSVEDGNAIKYGAVAAQDVLTATDGSFQARFTIKWEDLCQHPGALHIAFGDRLEEHDLLVAAQLQPALLTSSSTSSPNSPDPALQYQPDTVPSFSPTLPTTIHVSITHSPIRVISDIDDTIKMSNILSGARAVFHNVFVKDLQENIIPGMGEWYSEMWSRGIRFHYVSNGPFELLPVLHEFFNISQMPPGSIKLKSYAGRSLFNGLLSAPAIRKRAGVVDILNSFPDSRFFLIGDTGEQDLELYADLARERPNQILAVLVRDVETVEPIDDPTGWKAIGVAGTRSTALIRDKGTDDTLRPRRAWSDLLSTRSSSKIDVPPGPGSADGTLSGAYFTPLRQVREPEPITSTSAYPRNSMSLAPSSQAALTRATPSPATSFRSDSSHSSMSSTSTNMRLSETEKKRHMLQKRVYRARTQMPGHVPLRVFRDPVECVEVDEILAKEPAML